MSQFSVITNDFVNVFVSSNTSFTSEKKVESNMIKEKFYQKPITFRRVSQSGQVEITRLTVGRVKP